MYFVLLFFLLAISAIVSASESACRNINSKKIEELVEENNNSAVVLLRMMKDPASLLATTMISNSFSNAAITLMIFRKLISIDYLNNYLGYLIAMLISGSTTLVLVNLVPKTLAAIRPEQTALKLAYPLRILYLFNKPFVLVFSLIFKPLLQRMVRNYNQLMKQLTAEEIKNIVDISHESGELEQYETEIIKSALTIDGISVSSVLTPRVDIECISVDATVKETLDIMLEQEYSRLPVFEDSIDNIVGIVHIKDLFKATKNKVENSNKSILPFVREAFHVPENKAVSELLKEMQIKRIQMAIVSDEYGGTAGLVTMEDILEQIVGDIRDEHDSDELPMINEIDDKTVLVNAMVSVSEVNRILDVELPNNQTVGRLIFESLNDVPELGQIVNINNVTMQIKEIDGVRVQKVLIQKIELNVTGELTESEMIKS